MADGFQRFRSAATFQASAAITANSFSAGSQTDFNTTSVGNINGAFGVAIEIDVTVLASDSSCGIYQQALQHDGVGYCEEELKGSIPAITSTGKYTTTIFDVAEKGRLIIKAGTANMTASGSMRAVYPSDA